MQTQTCAQCSQDFENIGVHWARSDVCNHPNMTDHQEEVITGLLMGDGYIRNPDGKNPCITATMIAESYLKYIDDQIFPTTGGGVQLVEDNANSDTRSSLYRWRSMSHPELRKYAQWYSSGEKEFPDDIKLTPTVLKHWYCCDGHRIEHSASSAIEIAMTNEKENQGKIESMFERAGFEVSNWNTTGNRFHARFTVADSMEMWKYMGDPLPSFSYKWPEVMQ